MLASKQQPGKGISASQEKKRKTLNQNMFCVESLICDQENIFKQGFIHYTKQTVSSKTLICCKMTRSRQGYGDGNKNEISNIQRNIQVKKVAKDIEITNTTM